MYLKQLPFATEQSYFNFNHTLGIVGHLSRTAADCLRSHGTSLPGRLGYTALWLPLIAECETAAEKGDARMFSHDYSSTQALAKLILLAITGERQERKPPTARPTKLQAPTRRRQSNKLNPLQAPPDLFVSSKA